MKKVSGLSGHFWGCNLCCFNALRCIRRPSCWTKPAKVDRFEFCSLITSILMFFHQTVKSKRLDAQQRWVFCSEPAELTVGLLPLRRLSLSIFKISACSFWDISETCLWCSGDVPLFCVCGSFSVWPLRCATAVSGTRPICTAVPSVSLPTTATAPARLHAGTNTSRSVEPSRSSARHPVRMSGKETPSPPCIDLRGSCRR